MKAYFAIFENKWPAIDLSTSLRRLHAGGNEIAPTSPVFFPLLLGLRLTNGLLRAEETRGRYNGNENSQRHLGTRLNEIVEIVQTRMHHSFLRLDSATLYRKGGTLKGMSLVAMHAVL